jgi:hypothetical protein
MLDRLGMSVAGCILASLTTACGVGSTGRSLSWNAAKISHQRAYIRLPLSLLSPQFVRTTRWERDHKQDQIYAFGYVDQTTIDDLPLDVQRNIQILDAKILAHHEFDAKTLQLTEWKDSPSNLVFENYHNDAALTKELQDIAALHPDLVSLESIGKSVEKRNIWMLEISGENRSDEGLPKLLYVANMHGDEVVGRELMLYLSRHLTANYSLDSRIKNLVDHARIFIVPSLNPDGFEKEQRYNADDVDLNRDFPDFTSDNHDTPEGRAIETEAMMSLHQKHHFILAANFHGGEVCFNMPWDTKYNDRADQRFGDDLLMRRLARQYADANKTMRANHGGSFDRGVTYGYEWYEVDGGLQDWSIHYRESTHGTVELSYAKWPPANQLPKFWDENREALVSYLENGLFGVHIRVQDILGAPIHGARIKTGSLQREVTYPTAKIHRPALRGVQGMRITAPGFAPVEKTIEPSTFDGTYQAIILEK